jgi:pyruvate dehydrogenase E1 component
MTSEDFQTLIDELTPDRVEWVQALDDIYNEFGEPGVREILRTLQDHVLNCGIPLAEATLNTPYINSIPPSDEPRYPGDTGLEKKIENIIRWNAMAIVLQAADAGIGVGGHIATYASAATMMEVGFHHFFRNRTDEYGGGGMWKVKYEYNNELVMPGFDVVETDEDGRVACVIGFFGPITDLN